MVKVKFEGNNVFIGTEEKVILEVWLDRYTTPERSQNYISVLVQEVDKYIKGATEEPEYFCLGSSMSQMYGGHGKREIFYRHTGIRAAVCHLLLADEKMDDNFIKRIILILEKYWKGGDF